MRLIWKVLFLLLLSCAVEAGFVIAYQSAAEGRLATAIAAHTESFTSETIPSADNIDLLNDDWVKVAHFESTFYKIQFFVDIIMSLVFGWVLIMGGVSAAIARKTRELSPNIHVARGLYLTFVAILFAGLTLPTGISSALIGHLRGTLLVTPDSVVVSFITNTVLGVIFALLIFIPFYFLIDRMRHWWWLVCGLFVSAFTVFTIFIGPVVIDPLYIDAEPLTDPAVVAIVKDVAKKANVPLERVYVANTYGGTLESNAVVVGLGKTKRVVLDDTLIKFYTPDEISTIVAHEFGHYVFVHIVRTMAIMVLVTLLSFWLLSVILHFLIRRYGAHIKARQVNDIVLYPLIGTLIGFISLLFAPISSYVNRTFEMQADAYSINLTHKPAAAVTALTKLTYQSFIDPSPPPILQWWLGTHPTQQERIDFARSQIKFGQ